jgi:hypothetical protein
MMGAPAKLMTDDRAALLNVGYVQKSDLVSPTVIAAARTAIAADRARSYDPALRDHYNKVSWCPDLRSTSEIGGLFTACLKHWVDTLYGAGAWTCGSGQIAIREAKEVSCLEEPYPHIDGGWGFGEPQPVGALVHDGILGIFLTDVCAPGAGNLWVWPASHGRIVTHFRKTEDSVARAGLPELATLGLTAPVELYARAGDTILLHGLLAHAVGNNASASDREAVYFRIEPVGQRKNRSLRQQLTLPPFF